MKDSIVIFESVRYGTSHVACFAAVSKHNIMRPCLCWIVYIFLSDLVYWDLVKIDLESHIFEI
jgi:hypothetical protein